MNEIVGRSMLSDIELDDSIKPTSAHSALTTSVEDGREIKILRGLDLKVSIIFSRFLYDKTKRNGDGASDQWLDYRGPRAMDDSERGSRRVFQFTLPRGAERTS